MALNSKSTPFGATVGKTFGRLTVIKEEQVVKSNKSRIIATCICECGNEKICVRDGLTQGSTASCGCFRQEKTRETNAKKRKPRGQKKSDDRRYNMFHNAKHRAKRKGLPFTITIEDIVIPGKCPLLGIELVSTNDKRDPRNPSLDQIDPGKGYTPENIWVVSSRANWLKGDATFTELETLLINWRKLYLLDNDL